MDKLKINYDLTKITPYKIFTKISENFKSWEWNLIFTLDTLWIRLLWEDYFNQIINQQEIDHIENFERKSWWFSSWIDLPIIFDPEESRYYSITDWIKDKYNIHIATK